jgi:hypothetical protein
LLVVSFWVCRYIFKTIVSFVSFSVNGERGLTFSPGLLSAGREEAIHRARPETGGKRKRGAVTPLFKNWLADLRYL